MPRETTENAVSHKDYDRKRDRERQRHRDRSVHRYKERRSSERYHSSRYRERSKSRSGSRTRKRSRSRSSHRNWSKSRSRRGNSHNRSRKSRSSSRSRCRSKQRSSPYRENDLERRKTDNNVPTVRIKTQEEIQSIALETKARNAQYTSDETSKSPTTYESFKIKEEYLTNADEGNSISELEEPFDKEKIHKEIEEKLRLALAKEGKVYPPPKPEPSHPVFANDGSFLEIFKKMQEQMQQSQQQNDNDNKSRQPICKRRGGKILKTGIVAKARSQEGSGSVDPKDFWSLYLQEVKKYKNTSCDVDSKTRPLVK